MNVKVNPNRCPYCGFRLSHTWACPNAPRVQPQPEWVTEIDRLEQKRGKG